VSPLTARSLPRSIRRPERHRFGCQQRRARMAGLIAIALRRDRFPWRGSDGKGVSTVDFAGSGRAPWLAQSCRGRGSHLDGRNPQPVRVTTAGCRRRTRHAVRWAGGGGGGGGGWGAPHPAYASADVSAHAGMQPLPAIVLDLRGGHEPQLVATPSGSSASGQITSGRAES